MRIGKRLKAVMKDGDLFAADLERWFKKPQSTIWFWVEKNRTVRATARQKQLLEYRLQLLEYAIQIKRLPAPDDLTQRGRAHHIEALRNELENAGISASGASR
jgi:hypothetical protein